MNAECSSCGGTGLYSGMCEAKGTAVICLTCNGTGCEIIRYKPFVKRNGKRMRDIKKVFSSRGSFIATGVGAVGKSVTYAEFKKGVMPS